MGSRTKKEGLLPGQLTGPNPPHHRDDLVDRNRSLNFIFQVALHLPSYYPAGIQVVFEELVLVPYTNLDRLSDMKEMAPITEMAYLPTQDG